MVVRLVVYQKLVPILLVFTLLILIGCGGGAEGVAPVSNFVGGGC